MCRVSGLSGMLEPATYDSYECRVITSRSKFKEAVRPFAHSAIAVHFNRNERDRIDRVASHRLTRLSCPSSSSVAVPPA